MMIDHFIAYRIAGTGFFQEEARATSQGEKVMSCICSAQPIIGKIPIIGDLVALPLEFMS
jgi:hypothetical protein